ncbi:MAG: hypothetical protein OEW05_05340 [Candidatus Aminicenantes bacterium]|nr:hypothetical protein [Candidatus Aminicenantes bacterium]
MRKKPDSSFLAAVLILAILPGAGIAQKAAPPAARPERLVRVDLLTPAPVEARPVRRDVFSPSSDSAAPLAGIGLPTMPGQPGAGGTPAGPGASQTAPIPPAAGGEAPVYIPSIRYIGYVDFGRKLTALVIADGQPLAVEEEEELLPGYRVVAITAERIEIADPNGTKRPYLREGEQP